MLLETSAAAEWITAQLAVEGGADFLVRSVVDEYISYDFVIIENYFITFTYNNQRQ